jgi:radical SAM/Cys-rich protein
MHDTLPLLVEGHFPPIRRRRLETLQLNLGYRCNQSCLHCHVSAGPNRTEEMTGETIDLAIAFMKKTGVAVMDVTGGAPEMNPRFRYLVDEARRLGVHVMDRCNLTILEEPGQEDLAEFLASRQVEVVASLPCYQGENVDAQRGKGVFAASLAGLKRLNALGYGVDGSGLELSLVFNPQGPVLPPSQLELEAAYKEELGSRFGIRFTRLLTMANVPIGRFGSVLVSKGQFNGYMDTLRGAHRDDNLEGVMCRSTVSVDWQGDLYDCDFNQMLGLPLRLNGYAQPTLKDLLQHELDGNSITVRDHCYACTAGQGSSCGGALI